ncbi:Hydrophobin-like protein ssgA [Metarhizium anisopliae]
MFKALIVALAAVAAAVPTSPSRGDNVCDNGSAINCCNKAVENTFEVLADAFGATCGNTLNLIPLSVLEKECTGQTVCCSEVKQEGLVNVACTPVSV